MLVICDVHLHTTTFLYNLLLLNSLFTFRFGAWLISTGEIQGGDVLTVCALLFDLTQLQYLIAIQDLFGANESNFAFLSMHI